MTELSRSKVAGDLERLETPIPVTSPAQYTLCVAQIAVLGVTSRAWIVRCKGVQSLCALVCDFTDRHYVPTPWTGQSAGVWAAGAWDRAGLFHTGGRLRLNLNPLNLVRWIDSRPFDKTWKPGWIDSTWVNRFNGRAMNLKWIFIKTPSRARMSFSKASPYFFCKDRAGFDGDGFNVVRLFRVFSEDSAERDSLDESSAFLI